MGLSDLTRLGAFGVMDKNGRVLIGAHLFGRFFRFRLGVEKLNDLFAAGELQSPLAVFGSLRDVIDLLRRRFLLCHM